MGKKHIVAPIMVNVGDGLWLPGFTALIASLKLWALGLHRKTTVACLSSAHILG
jgi:hypothetical protein